jgi:V/A-type H+-transporting ATPase subunit I
MIRPQPARWFEILAARDDATLVLEALAATGEVELEPASSAGLPATLAEVQPLLAQFAELAQRYAPYWPPGAHTPSPFPEPPATTLARALAHLRAFAADAESLITALQDIAAERAQLDVWSRAVAAMRDSPLDFARLAAAGPIVAARLFALPAGTAAEFPDGALVRRVTTSAGPVALAVGSPETLREADARVAAAKGRACDAPAWLAGDAAATAARIEERRAELVARAAALQTELAALHVRHELHVALGDAERLQWVIGNVHALASGELFCWITGWTSDRAGARLARAVERCGARALLHFPPTPAGLKAPLLLENASWVRPFELFARALGMPARDEVDPSVLLALCVPLMFGYMFGDVGQGLLIAVTGVALAKRYVIARLFIAGGLSAAVFGLLFGSVFSVHGLVPPLWVDPLAAPLTILLVPIVGGAVMMTAGLLLNAVAAYWRHDLPAWLATDAGFIAAYLGVLLAFVDPSALWIAAAGASMFVLGHALHARRGAAAATALAELLERLVQILINTLSFARVGAFALAHAGLSSAIVALTAASDNVLLEALVLVAGNALVIVLETMVVSIQTTRLVLFEFFTRFLKAEGRVFHPLPPPPSARAVASARTGGPSEVPT